MRKILALACCAFAVPAWSADVGIGASAESNDSTIYVPIDFGTTWRLEPFVNYTKVTQETPGGFSLDNETLRIGTGIFGLQSIGESMRFYYGGRLAYLDTRMDRPVQNFVVSVSGDGYRIAPTLGFEYLFNEHISLGGEAEYYFEDLDRGAGVEEERSGTDTRLILRFRF